MAFWGAAALCGAADLVGEARGLNIVGVVVLKLHLVRVRVRVMD